MKRLRARFFDFDDTLVATKDISYENHKRAALSLGLKVPSQEEFFSRYGYPWMKFLKEIFPTVAPQKFVAEYFKSSEDYPIIDGSLEALDFLLARDIHLGILTTRTLDSVKIHVKKYFPNKFNSIFSCANSYHKPDKRAFNCILKAMNKLKIPKTQVLYVGDALQDYIAARGAKIDFVAVLTGYTKKEQFILNGLKEEKLLDSVKKLPDYLIKNKLC